MPDLQTLALFIIAGVLLNLTPGVDLLYILGQAGARGLRAGIVATAGVCAGCSVHIAAATLGVSALLATSATAFTVLKAIGAAYLIFLGVKLWLPTLRARRTPVAGSGSDTDARPETPGRRPSATPFSPMSDPARNAPDLGSGDAAGGLLVRRTSFDAGPVFIGGFLTNALNPKVALFFLAFLPQFIAPGSDHQALAMLLLGLLFVFNSFLVNAALAWGATRLARRLGERPAVTRWMQRLTGSLFIYFGLRLLGSRAPG